jgi:hypothetical protein
MPKAKSKKQQMAVGTALGSKRGENKVIALKGASRDMYRSMSEKELHDMARNQRGSLPNQKKHGG